MGVIAVDTNVVIRLLTRDDETQYQKSLTLFQTETEILIPITVVLETEWVLRFSYKFPRSDISQGLKRLLGLSNIQVDPKVHIAIEWYEQGLDFADALHLAQTQNCEAIYSFDQRFHNRAKSLQSSCETKLL